LIGIGHVAGEDLDLTSGLGQAFRRLVCFLFVTAVGDQKVEPFGCQPVGDGEADAPSTTGNDRYFGISQCDAPY
jgi:hypothetical protein